MICVKCGLEIKKGERYHKGFSGNTPRHRMCPIVFCKGCIDKETLIRIYANQLAQFRDKFEQIRNAFDTVRKIL